MFVPVENSAARTDAAVSPAAVEVSIWASSFFLDESKNQTAVTTARKEPEYAATKIVTNQIKSSILKKTFNLQSSKHLQILPQCQRIFTGDRKVNEEVHVPDKSYLDHIYRACVIHAFAWTLFITTLIANWSSDFYALLFLLCNKI